MKQEKIVIKEERPLKEYNDNGSWHKSYDIPLNQGQLIVRGMITGCGLAQMLGAIYLSFPTNNNLTKENFIKKFSSAKSDGIGGIVCTLGQGHFDCESRLLELGFERLSEYPNYRHGSSGGYKQRIYILKL